MYRKLDRVTEGRAGKVTGFFGGNVIEGGGGNARKKHARGRGFTELLPRRTFGVASKRTIAELEILRVFLSG